jgi:hypothetical protein
MQRYLLIGVVLVGCAPARFPDRAILWHDPDDAPIPAPSSRDPPYHWVALRDAIFLPLDRGLNLDVGREATNVNAVDETPDSSWFTNRWRTEGVARPRHFSDEEMANGAFGTQPRPLLPLTVIKGKDRGGNLGFVVKDALGRQFAIKIDPPGLVGMDTATEVVVSRLVWAAGWNVPAETLIDLHPGDLVLSPNATIANAIGDKRPLGPARFKEILEKLPVGADGAIQALASRWIEGIVLGPYAYFGRRADDANDRVPHQDRRDLRGYRVFCAWVNNIDTTEANTLDSYIGERGRGHVVHWQQDVGGAFGARAALPMQYWMGYDTYLSPGRMLASLATLGIYRQRWEGERVQARRARDVAQYPAIGWFDADDFDPRSWRAIFHNPAFARATARDRYWGAKRVIGIDARELRGAIAAGHYRPEAAERLFQILWRRRAAIARAYLAEVAALDYFRVSDGSLCWDDLWVEAGLGEAPAQHYRVDGRLLPPDTRCAVLPPPSPSGYRVLSLQAQRPGRRSFGPRLRVHLRSGADGRGWHLVGIER